MAFGRRRAAPRATVTTTTTKPTLMGRLKGQRTRKTTTTRAAKPRFTRTHAAPRTRVVAAPRRKASLGDKVSGAMMKLRGSLTRKPGLKAAGTRRMHGTDGRGSRRVY